MAEVHATLKPDPDDKDGVLLAKGVSMIVLFLACMICGIIPLLVAKKFPWLFAGDVKNLRSSNKIVMTLLSFGGGVLLATTFMHLMPEVEDNILELQEKGDLKTYSFEWAHLLTCSGFFMMYLVEELIHAYIRRREAKKIQAASPNNHRDIITNGVKKGTYFTADIFEAKMDADSYSVHHTHDNLLGNIDDTVSSALRGLLIVLALSVHELFEGLAVGLESSTSKVWYMLGAVAGHKLVIAFCISIELIASKTILWLTMVYIVVYAIISPLGIGIGMLLVGGSGAAAAGIPSVLLQGLACGTLLYVIFFEIWSGEKISILQFIGSIVGFFFMFGIIVLFRIQHYHLLHEKINEGLPCAEEMSSEYEETRSNEAKQS